MESKTQYRVGAAGLDPRDVRLIEVVFRHSQYNRHAFVLVSEASPASIDILIANPAAAAGAQALDAARDCGRVLPTIVAVPRGTASAARHAISIDRLTLQLLPILNRVVEHELSSPQAALSAALAPAMLAAPGAPARVSRPSPLLQPSSGPGPDARPAAATPSPTTLPTPRTMRPPPAPSRTVAVPDDGPADSAALAAAFASTLAQDTRMRTEAMAGEGPTTVARPAGAAADEDWPTTMTSALASAVASMGAGFEAAAPGPTASAAQPSPVAPATRSGPMPTPAPRPRPAGQARAAADAGTTEPVRAALAPTSGRSAPDNLVPFPGQPGAVPPPRLKVLAVDDSPTVRRQLVYAFDRMGLACITEDSAEGALDRLEREHVDLMLVDVELPDMDGYKLTRAVKRDRRFRRLPVVMLTSRASAFDLARGALAGCDSYLAKPVPLRTLEQTVTRVLRKSLAIDDLDGLLSDAGPVASAGSAPSDVSEPDPPRRAAGPS